jgi:predicted nucleotidyltransferase
LVLVRSTGERTKDKWFLFGNEVFVMSGVGIGACFYILYLWIMYLQEYIKDHSSGFRTLCETHHVRSIYAFGSSTKSSFDVNSSDIDLVVDIDENDPIKRGNNLLDLWTKLEEFFRRKVDLLTPSSIKNPVLKMSIDQSKVLIYER